MLNPRPKMSAVRKLKSLALVTLGGYSTYAGISIYRNDEHFYKSVIMPFIHFLPPEGAHKLAVMCSKYRIIPKSGYKDPESLRVKLFNKQFSNPIGIAAGFDKNGEAVLGLRDLGFGFVEIGSVTPVPQPGNDKPRVFRLLEDRAVINRYGFNNDGHDEVYERVKNIKNSGFDGVLGVNLGKNKNSPDAIDDYVQGIKKFGPIVDYLVINVSSPNTPGLRSLQNKESLRELFSALVETRNNLEEKPPLLLKLAPDLSYKERKDVAEVILLPECRVDGLIISNTTIERPNSLLNISNRNESGGLSGEPLKQVSTEMIRDMARLTHRSIPIIGVGGISSGKDAYDKIKAGASVVQIYTAMVYEGPPVVDKIKKQLVALLKKDGYRSINEAIGKNVFK